MQFVVLLYFINNASPEESFLESKIREYFNSIDNPTLVLRAAKTIPLGHIITRTDLEVLRPCPSDCLGADAIEKLIGLKSQKI